MTSAIKSKTSAAAAVQHIELAKLHPAPWNESRPIDDGYVQSIREKGQLVTAMARPHPIHENEFEIVYGHRRAEALRAIEAETMRCEVRDLSDEEAEELGAAENAQRAGLTWQQQCRLIEGYLLRHDDDDAPARIGSALGISTGQVKRRARMLSNLSPAWRSAISEGELPAWTVDHFEILTVFDEKAQEELHKEIKYRAGGFSLTELKEEISDRSASLKSAPWDLDDVTLIPKVGACTGCPKRSDAQADLFGQVPDMVKAGASCLDADCYKRKAGAHTKRKEAAILEKHPDAIKVSDGYSGGKNTLKPHEYTEAKKGDKGAVIAIKTGDGGKVTQTYVKVKKSAQDKDPSPKSLAKEAERKRLIRIEALAIDKLIDIVEDETTEFADEAYPVLVQYCLVNDIAINIDEEEVARRVRAYAKKPVTIKELWEAASIDLVRGLNRAKWMLERNERSAEDEPAVELAAWMVEADLNALRKEAEAEIAAAPATEAAGTSGVDLAGDDDEAALD